MIHTCRSIGICGYYAINQRWPTLNSIEWWLTAIGQHPWNTGWISQTENKSVNEMIEFQIWRYVKTWYEGRTHFHTQVWDGLLKAWGEEEAPERPGKWRSLLSCAAPEFSHWSCSLGEKSEDVEGSGDEHAVEILNSVSCNIDDVSEVFTLTNKNLP